MGGVCLLLGVLSPGSASAIQWRSAQVTLPEQAHIMAPPSVKVVREDGGRVRLYFNPKTAFPIKITVADLFGAHVDLYIKDPSQLWQLSVADGVVKTQQASPVAIDVLPKLCPRAKL